MLSGFLEDDGSMFLSTRRYDDDIRDRWDTFEFFIYLALDGEICWSVTKEDTSCIVTVIAPDDEGSVELCQVELRKS